VWAWWVFGGLFAWLVVGTIGALLIGASVRLADRRAEEARSSELPEPAPAPTNRVARPPATRRRRFAFPILGVGLVVIAMSLMVSGYVVRLSGASGPLAELLSMDAPFSVPRLFVASMFAAAGMAAMAGAGSIPGRRTWWTAVAAVACGVAVVKTGSTLLAAAFELLAGAITTPGAVAVSVFLAGAVVAALWVLSRGERRDRRRVLGVLALYAGASVGLSAVSTFVGQALGGGSTWTAAATFVEETGEALAGVGFLVAVLVGVAPRLVLPRDWVLQREADAHTLQVPDLSGPSPSSDPTLG
jgi:hypothetical protein